MYPREITSTPLWIRHNLPLRPAPPPNGDIKLKREVKLRFGLSSTEEIEKYARQERARLDLKWCLDEYFGGNECDLQLGRMVTVNFLGSARLAYITNISHIDVKVISADNIDDFATIGFDDIYSAENGPFYEGFLVHNRVLHSQHVLDYIANKKETIQSVMQLNQKFSWSTPEDNITCQEETAAWAEGNEEWLIHDQLPQRAQFLSCIRNFNASTCDDVEEITQQPSGDINSVVLSSGTQNRELMIWLHSAQMKCEEFVAENEVLERMVARHRIILNQTASADEISKKEPCVSSFVQDQSDERRRQGAAASIADTYEIVDGFTLLIGSFNTVTWTNFVFKTMELIVLGYYLMVYETIRLKAFQSTVLFDGKNSFDWFRTLTVP